MRLDELLQNLQNDEEIMEVIKDYEIETKENVSLDMEEFQGNHFQIRLMVDYNGIERKAIETWSFFNKKEYEDYMPIIDNERFENIAWWVKEDIREMKDIIMEDE